MKPSRPQPQLNLPLLNQPPCPLPDDKHAELVLALVDLLIQAAEQAVTDHRNGGDHEREAHR